MPHHHQSNKQTNTGNAAALAGNPGLIDAIQAKLDTIVGLPSGFIEEMPVEVGFVLFFLLF